MKRIFLCVAAITAGLAVFAGPAVACGGLVGENGTIQLVRTSTLAAYHDGVERYVTSFEFVGEGAEVGSIIPLPDVPSSPADSKRFTRQSAARSREAKTVTGTSPNAKRIASSPTGSARAKSRRRPRVPSGGN